MARKKLAEENESAAKVWVLTHNHGIVSYGRSGTFLEAGKELTEGEDDDLIAQLVRSGAVLEEK
ncbi:hypothetical protein ACHHY8_02535 [Enterobacter cloacae complex sp. 2024EL-00215]|uniref:hypothetical protein n=1 Tax=unclassified Enterobacter cloacae complex TaxID=2757714 RepID=UPI0037537CA7